MLVYSPRRFALVYCEVLPNETQVLEYQQGQNRKVE